VVGLEKSRAPQIKLVLGAILLLFGVATALNTAWIVHKSFSPILFFDQWGLVNQLMQSNGHLSLAQLWALHNEHRIPWGKLAGYVDLKAFGGRNVSLLLEVYLIQVLESGFLIWIFRRYSGCNLAEVMTAAGLFLFAMFCPIQIENFYWGFQVAFVMLPSAASVSIGCAILHADPPASGARTRWCSWPLIISLVCGLLAETSLASGLLIWPLLLLLSFILGMPAKTKYLIGSVGAVATAGYLWGFHSPGNTANPLDSLRHPVAVAEFVRACLALSWDPAAPAAMLWPTLAQLCAAIAVAVVVFVFARIAWSHSNQDRLQLFLASNAIFLLVTLLVIALGRINFGIQQASASRYQTIALAFWGSVGALVLLWRAKKQASPSLLIEMQVVLLLLMMASVPRNRASAEIARAHQRSVGQAYAAAIQDPSNSAVRANFSPYPNFAEAHAYLQSQHLGLDDRDFLPQGSLQPVNSSETAQMKVNGYKVLSTDQCAGHLDWVKLVSDKTDGVDAGGWAWAPTASPRRILLVLDDGAVVGSGRILHPRPDVAQRIATIREQNTGWTAQASLPRGRTLRAFVVSNDSGYACILPDEFRSR
jgi:hypothetical protein